MDLEQSVWWSRVWDWGERIERAAEDVEAVVGAERKFPMCVNRR
jgi:hypothetical protein